MQILGYIYIENMRSLTSVPAIQETPAVLGSGVPPDYHGRDSLRVFLVLPAPRKHVQSAS